MVAKIRETVARNEITGKRIAYGITGSLASAAGLGYLLHIGAHVVPYHAGVGARQNKKREVTADICAYYLHMHPTRMSPTLYTASVEASSPLLSAMTEEARRDFLAKPHTPAFVALGFGVAVANEQHCDYVSAAIGLDWPIDMVNQLYASLCSINGASMPPVPLYLPFSRMRHTSIMAYGFEWRTPYGLTFDCASGIYWLPGKCQMCDKCKQRAETFRFMGLPDFTK